MTLRVRSLKVGTVTLAMMAAAVAHSPASVASSTHDEVSTSSTGATQNQCRLTEWTQYGNNYITDEISPWFNSVRGIDFSRKIQFRVLSGIYAKRTTDACLVQRASFAGASQYREEQCARPGACKLTAWLHYGENVKPVEFRFPNRRAGYDPHSDLFNTWDAPCCPPPG